MARERCPPSSPRIPHASDRLPSLPPRDPQADFKFQDLLDKLVALGEAEDIPFVEADWNTSLPAIELRLKAILARNLFDSGAFYEVFNPINPVFRRGVEVLNDGTYKSAGIANR